MKTLIRKSALALATGLCVFFSSPIKASEAPNKLIVVNSIEEIKHHISFNELQLKGTSEIVKVVFTVNELGVVDLVIANTNNQLIKQSIEKQFSNLVFENLKTNHTYGIQFNFKTI